MAAELNQIITIRYLKESVLIEEARNALKTQYKLWDFIAKLVNSDVPDDSPVGKLFAEHEATATGLDWELAELLQNGRIRFKPGVMEKITYGK
jgi:hypothetical protein